METGPTTDRGGRKQEAEIDAWKGGDERKPWRAQTSPGNLRHPDSG